MAFDELDRVNEPPERKINAPGSWDSLSDKERKERFARRERLGLVGAQDDGFFGELSDQFQGSVISGLKGIGATANELGLGSGMQDYFQGVLNRNQQWNTPEERSVAGYIGGAIGNAAGSTAVIAPAIAADALFGTKGVATFSLVFGQTFGDNLQRNREAYGPDNEAKSAGLAAAESTVDSFIEIALGTIPMLGKSLKGLTYAGKRQLVKGMFREAEKQLGRSGAKRFFLGMAKNGAEEMTEEGLQYINSWMWRAMGGDQNNEFKVGEMADSMAQGLIGGAALGIAGGAQETQLYGKPRPWLNPQTPVSPAAAPSAAPTDAAAPAPGMAPGMETVNPMPETEAFNPEEAKSTSARLTEEVAKEMGLKVRYFDEEGAPSPVDDKGNAVNGWYDEKTNEYWIDRNDPEMNPLETLGHEFKHFLDQNHSDLVKTFDELLKSGMNEAGKQALAETEADYRQGGYAAGQGEIEFSADTFGKMWTDPEFWRDVTQRAEKLNPGMGQRMLDALQEFIKVVRAKLKNIGTPEAKVLFDNMGELRSEAARIMAEIKRQNGTSTEAENVVGVKGSDMVQSIPVSELDIDPARFQFKSKANKVTGVDESNKLGGEWDPKTAGNLYVWEDKNGKKFVVNGHHRFYLAKNSNVQAVNAIVDREADGVTAEQARRNGVLINIRDEQGDVKDYADFVRQEDMSEETAEKEGILAREKGRRGYTIGKYASDNLYSIFKSDDITEPKAETIADIARKDEGLEAAGIRAAKTMPNAQLRGFLKCLKNMPREKNEQGDLFGFDDSAIQMSEKLSKLASKHIREIGDKLKAVHQAVKNPETAAKGDVKVGKNAQKIYDQTLRDQMEWEHWYTNPELSNLLKKEAGIESPQSGAEMRDEVGERKENTGVKENLTTAEEIPDVGDSISKTFAGTQARVNALHNLKDGKYHAFGLTFEKTTEERSVYDEANPDRKMNETLFVVDGKRFNILEFEEKISRAEGQESFKKQYNPDKEPREITSSTYDRAQKRLEQQASGIVTGKNVSAGPDITSKESGRFNIDSDTPLLTPEEDASDFQLFSETPEEARANDARAEREEKERIERAQEEAKKASPDLDFSAPEEQKQDADTIIRKTAPGSSERVNAFMKLPDGEHTVDGKKFTKNGFQFERDGQKLSARGIERSFKDVPKVEIKNTPAEQKQTGHPVPVNYKKWDGDNWELSKPLGELIPEFMAALDDGHKLYTDTAKGIYHLEKTADGKYKQTLPNGEERIISRGTMEMFIDRRLISDNPKIELKEELRDYSIKRGNQKNAGRFAAYLEARQKDGTLKATENDIQEIKKFYDAFPLGKRIQNRWGEEISFLPQDPRKVDDYIQHFAVKRGGGLEKFSQNYRDLFLSLEDALKNPDERILTENETGDRRICFTKRIEENGNHFVVTAISENGHLLAWTHMKSSDSYIEKQRKNEKAAVEKYGVVNRDGVKQDLTYEEYLKAKEDMPLYLATAQTNQNSFPQAENSDGTHNINQDSEKIKDKSGENAEKDYSLKRHKVNPVKEEGSFADQVQRDLDEQQAHFAEKQSMSNAKATEAAEEWIKQQGGYEKAIRYVAQGRTMPQGSVRTEIMYLIHNSPEFKALPRETQKQFTQSHGEHTSFLGQELQALRDDALTLDTVEKVNARIEKYTESLGDTEYQELRNVIKEKTGVDLADLPPEIIHDKHKLDQVLRETLTRSLPFFKSLPDRLSELWINFLLSGLRTHTKNTAGNLLNAAYELGPKRFTEAAINLIAKKKDAATFGEFKELFRHVDWESAWEGAKESFDLEVLDPEGKLDSITPTIPGTAGRVIRTPGRFLKAADRFAKEVLRPIEATSHAFREGKSNGLTGEQLKNFITAQLADPKSKANEYGKEQAAKFTFTDKVPEGRIDGDIINKILQLKNKGGIQGALVKGFFPFVGSPYNILRQGVRKSHLGAVNLAIQTGRAFAGKRKFDNEYIQHTAEQVLVWGMTGILYSMFGNGDGDDEPPVITGSGGRRGSTEQKFNMQNLPANSIRIGGKWYDYSGLEPLAHVLNALGNTLEAFQSGDSKRYQKAFTKTVESLADKDYFQTFQEISNILHADEYTIKNTGANYISSWMPNFVRQFALFHDDNIGEQRGADFFDLVKTRSGFRTLAPKVDYFGRDIPRDVQESTGGSWLWRFAPWTEKDVHYGDEGDELLRNYNYQHRREGEPYFVPGISRTGKVNGRKIVFSGETYHDLCRESGELAHRKILEGIRRGFLHVDNPSEKEMELVKKVFERAKRETRAKFIRAGRFEFEEE